MDIPAYETDNIFARIIRGEIPNTTVYEDEDVLSFMDLFPQSEGHTLVIPKKAEAVNFLDIDPNILGVLIQRTQIIATAINTALRPDGIRLIQFNGEAAGQTVFHLHFHIIPVWQNANMKPHADSSGNGQADPVTLQKLAERIKACL